MECASTVTRFIADTRAPTDPRRAYERPSLTNHGSLAMTTGGFNLGITADGAFMLS
jgi:hypothetical protein